MKSVKICALLGMALSLTMLTVVILDLYNPMMGFLMGQPARTYLVALSLVCIIQSSILLKLLARKRRARERAAQKRRETDE